jgi:hypothetical protein
MLGYHVRQTFICGTEKAHCCYAVRRVNDSKCGTHGVCLDLGRSFATMTATPDNNFAKIALFRSIDLVMAQDFLGSNQTSFAFAVTSLQEN